MMTFGEKLLVVIVGVPFLACVVAWLLPVGKQIAESLR